MTWLHELRDRKLVQWLLAYLAAAWVLAQVADLAAALRQRMAVIAREAGG